MTATATDYKVLAQQGEWARVVRADGWVGWVAASSVAGGRLDPAAMATPARATSTAPSVPATDAPPGTPIGVDGSAFRATHLVPEGGLGAWTTPDPGQAPSTTLGGGLDVLVLHRSDDWAFVECSNGWTAWTDGRYLVARSGAVSGAWRGTTSPDPVRTPARLVKTAAPALLGAVMVLVGSFLPWIGTAGGFGSSTAWDLPIGFLTSNTPAPSDIDLGWTALVVLPLFLVPLLRRTLPNPLTGAIGLVALVVPAAIVFRAVTNDGYGPRVGVYLALAGGAVISAAATFASPAR